MIRQRLFCLAALCAASLANLAGADPIPLVNPDFSADMWPNEETRSVDPIGWTANGLVLGYNLDGDADGDPTDNVSPLRTWGGWQPGDGLYQVGFQADAAAYLQQDVGSFIEGGMYTFSIQTGPGFEGANQTAFIEIRRVSDDMLLATNSDVVMQSGSSTSDLLSVMYTATAADAGSPIGLRFGSTGSGTATFTNASLDGPAQIPEPSSIALVALGLSFVAAASRAKQ